MLLLGAAAAFSDRNFRIFNPAGPIAAQQRDLIYLSMLLMLLVIIPVFILVFFIAWKYRDRGSGHKAKYAPDWDGNKLLESIWWGIPIVLITALSVIAWRTSHSLDPFRPIASHKPAVKVQVIALQWKWLFLYPEEGVASVNYLRIPAGRPINFDVTSDAPMNSFWIPELGGQIYAMAGMRTKLYLQAGKPGIYRGSSANISGAGFAGMQFNAEATTSAKYTDWLKQARTSQNELTMGNYANLARPSQNEPPRQFVLADPTIFQQVIDHYMKPATTAGMPGMTH